MLHTHLMRLINKSPWFPLGGFLSFVPFHPMFKPPKVSVSLRIGSPRAKFLIYLVLPSILNLGLAHDAGYFHSLLVHFLETTKSISYYYLFHFPS